MLRGRIFFGQIGIKGAQKVNILCGGGAVGTKNHKCCKNCSKRGFFGVNRGKNARKTPKKTAFKQLTWRADYNIIVERVERRAYWDEA